ncbi:MAG: RNA-binding transcriptional accessory protein [Erysipelotrichaceae bacterium]|nr:RNA-binding transcriptional accessory protein [Erysipelotrichaceae bacterium]
MEEIIKQTAGELKIREQQVKAVLDLLAAGNTIPFIARYRKEMTGALDEEVIRHISEHYEYRKNLAKRKEDVLRLIETQDKLTPELRVAIEQAQTLSRIEDLYRPYQQKKKTRASEAKRKGLQPFADYLLSLPRSGEPLKEALKYLNDEVTDREDALQGAEDIVAEMVSDDADLRAVIRNSITERGRIETVKKKDAVDEKKVYQKYYEYSEPVRTLQPHRIMAINRAEKENVISVRFIYDEAFFLREALRRLTNGKMGVTYSYLREAAEDGLKRLALPSVEREIRNELSEKAAAQSIDVFAANLEKLLSTAPLKGRRILGFDPAFRTGCKLAVLDETGKLLEIAKIYPHEPHNRKAEAEKTMLELIRRYGIKTIAIGNGTASRESEKFTADLIRKYHLDVEYSLVSEAGASVYSASENARREFPDLHVEERSAVSIGRRLLDPLSELIKIDPESIGVGQYQHDLPQKELKERLDFTTLKVVNRVGADVNTAGEELLRHVAGLNKTTAANIVSWRSENGPFVSRKQLAKVPKLGPKALEQAYGFLRIRNGSEALDATSIHPESYSYAKAILHKCGDLPLGSKELGEALNGYDRKELSGEIGCDSYTLEDILKSLKEPLRDYRDSFEGPMLRSDILELKDLHPGDVLQGVVRNVVDFGAFVDIGLHEDGLIHRSKLGRKASPYEVLSVGDIVEVEVISIDLEREKVALALRS